MTQYGIRYSALLTSWATCLGAVVLVLMAVALPDSLLANDHSVSGPATVIDGQTVMIGDARYVLYGIAAPRLGQTCEWPDQEIPCGDVSRTALMDLVIASTVNCTSVADEEDPDNTPNSAIIAHCEVGGFDLGRNMVHTGWAVVDRRIGDRYSDTEDNARAAKRGLWKGSFTLPWEWK